MPSAINHRHRLSYRLKPNFFFITSPKKENRTGKLIGLIFVSWKTQWLRYNPLGLYREQTHFQRVWIFARQRNRESKPNTISGLVDATVHGTRRSGDRKLPKRNRLPASTNAWAKNAPGGSTSAPHQRYNRNEIWLGPSTLPLPFVQRHYLAMAQHPID